jgi:multiple sugar transport system substrate-binding protein
MAPPRSSVVTSRRRVLRQVLGSAVLAGPLLALANCGGSAAATVASSSSSAAPASGAVSTVSTANVPASSAVTSARVSAGSTISASVPAASAAPAGKALTLQIASWEKQEQGKQGYAMLAGEYAKVNPNVKIEQQIIPETLADYNSKVTAQLAGGTAPDLMETIWGLSQNLAVKGALQALDPYVARDKISTSDYVQTALELGRWPQKTGKYYAWYTMFSISPLYYNTALFQQAGQAPPDESWTWQHVLEVAQKLTKKGASAADSVFGYDPTYLTRTMLYAYGWDFANADGTKSALATQQSIDALQFWQDLIYKYAVCPPASLQFGKGAPAGVFSTTRLGMEIQATYQIGPYRQVKGLEWDVAVPPSGPAGRFTVVKGAPGHAIPTQSAHATEAWAFLSWWITHQTPTLVILEGNLPSKLSALQGYPQAAQKDNPVPAHIGILPDIATKYGKPVQVLPDNDNVKAPYYAERANILANKEDAQTGMTKAAQQMDGLLQKAIADQAKK